MNQANESSEAAQAMPVVADTGIWTVLVVEDDEQMQIDIDEELDGAIIAGRKVTVESVDFEDAFDAVRARRADLIVLDVYRGKPSDTGDPIGLKVLESLVDAGFVSVILYTGNPESVKASERPFVRVVGKDEHGVASLRSEIETLFAGRMPHVFRAIVGHLDRTLREYMWGFVQDRWATLQPISTKPEFMRLLLRRLSASLSREGVETLVGEAFGTAGGQDLAEDQAHPAEYYVMPPVGSDIRFGDIRIVKSAVPGQFRVVVWPSCDMVTVNGRKVKVDRVACALATPLTELAEFRAWVDAGKESKTKREDVGKTLANKRSGKGISADRFHYLPAFCHLPDLVVDFQDVERYPIGDIGQGECVATIASPFAEYMASRYIQYVGRLGVPDLDVESLLGRLTPPAGA